jgi:hypothetical protein
LGCQPFANEYWKSTGGTGQCEEAESVAAGSSGINFVLAGGNAITGTVYQSNGTTPIPNVYVTAFSADGANCGDFYGGTLTDANGEYCMNPPAGEYFVYADASLDGCQPYIDEYYSTTGGTNSCQFATKVEAGSSGGLGINFLLDDGYMISGKVTARKDGSPVKQVQMVLYSDQACDGAWYGGRPTDENGDYCVTVPPGTYYIYAEASHHVSQDYTDEWWTSGSGTLNCGAAEELVVTDSDVLNVDFILDTRNAVTFLLPLLSD